MLKDLCLPRGSRYIEKFYALTEKIAAGNDLLRENYKEIDLAEFLSFTVVIDEASEEIVAFSGLQRRPECWGSTCARILSRYYIVPEWRHRYSMFKPTNIFGFEMFEHQLDMAKRLDLATVFMSRESHLNAFKEFTHRLNERFNLDITVLPGKYMICGPEIKSPGCIQYIAKLDIFRSQMKFGISRVI